jgi:hypothetical protein
MSQEPIPIHHAHTIDELIQMLLEGKVGELIHYESGNQEDETMYEIVWTTTGNTLKLLWDYNTMLW